MRRSIVREAGRQVNYRVSHVTDSKHSKRSTHMLQQTKDEIYFLWRHRRWKERSVAASFGIDRESVEEVIRERVDQIDRPLSSTHSCHRRATA